MRQASQESQGDRDERCAMLTTEAEAAVKRRQCCEDTVANEYRVPTTTHGKQKRSMVRHFDSGTSTPKSFRSTDSGKSTQNIVDASQRSHYGYGTRQGDFYERTLQALFERQREEVLIRELELELVEKRRQIAVELQRLHEMQRQTRLKAPHDTEPVVTHPPQQRGDVEVIQTQRVGVPVTRVALQRVGADMTRTSKTSSAAY